eukprot:TRINITY_DN45329_c0_g1_i1.p1 TRINITY_DN45329_c0_g1~~TRINITY_DN45329_c0_g1_i1.p1  ORF type:complete len:222 (-),score=47.20 TRINITY_DN45329_c0_g1_i1:39-632(-)
MAAIMQQAPVCFSSPSHAKLTLLGNWTAVEKAEGWGAADLDRLRAVIVEDPKLKLGMRSASSSFALDNNPSARKLSNRDENLEDRPRFPMSPLRTPEDAQGGPGRWLKSALVEPNTSRAGPPSGKRTFLPGSLWEEKTDWDFVEADAATVPSRGSAEGRVFNFAGWGGDLDGATGPRRVHGAAGSQAFSDGYCSDES